MSQMAKHNWSALVVGFLFSLGLGISGMTQPAKVYGFLDIFGSWDPSLMFVMVGAISVHFLVYRLIRKKSSPLFAKAWNLPTREDLTPSLLVGGAIFGMGWGLAGYCPGPAITALASLDLRPMIFVVSMIAGMALFRAVDKKFKFKK